MKWIKATDKFPAKADWQLARIIGTKVSFPAVFAEHVIASIGGATYDRSLIEWFDTSNDEPVFTIDDISAAFYSARQYLGDDYVYSFDEYIKEKYNIDL
jgi:hypothetical protein